MKVITFFSTLIFINRISFCQEDSSKILPKVPIENSFFLDSMLQQKELEENLYYAEPKMKVDTPDYFKSYAAFKRAFLALNIDDQLPDLHLPKAKPGLPHLLDDKYVSSPIFALMSPISFFYYNFSKTEQSRRKVIILDEESAKYAVVNKKYNRQKIELWTGLKDKKLDRFMIYCDFKLEYLYSATEFDIITMVLKKLDEFRKVDTLNID